MDTPFGMSFDEIKAQADANMQADKGQQAKPEQTQAMNPPVENKTFLDMVEAAERTLAQDYKTDEKPAQAPGNASGGQTVEQPASGTQSGISFDNMLAQAGGNVQANALSFDDLFAQAKGSVQSKPQPEGSAAKQNEAPVKELEVKTEQPVVPSFDEMFAQAQAETQSAAQSGISFDNVMANVQAAAQGTAAGTAISFDNVIAQAEQSQAEQSQAEQSQAEQSQAEQSQAEQSQAEQPEAEQPEAEQPEAENFGRTSRGSKSRKKAEKAVKKEDEVKDPLPDTTEDYKVDVLGEGKAEAKAADNVKQPAQVSEGSTLSVETLFTPEEIESLRADIRLFVRKEFKRAMVGVVKELLAEFNE